MIEVAPKLFVGSQDDYEDMKASNPEGFPVWKVVHACKEPYHRQVLGYSGRAAPKDHPEYLFARRDNRLILNLIDADDPKYISKEIVDAAVAFIRAPGTGKVLVHCNQGQSRGPTLALLAIAPTLSADFLTAEEQFSSKLYPPYLPKHGMRSFAETHWAEYHAAT